MCKLKIRVLGDAVAGISFKERFIIPKTTRKVISISKLIGIIKYCFDRQRLKRLSHLIHLKQKGIVAFIKEHRTIKVLHLFRNYSAFIVVLSSALLVSATNLAAGRESSGFLFGYFGTGVEADTAAQSMFLAKAATRNNIALAPLVQAETVPDPASSDKKKDNGSLIIQGQSLVAGTSPVKKDPEEDGGVIIYEVKSGDTVSGIAAAHHISINTILWSNELDNVDSIKPGDKIFILPVSGLSYTVKSGDDLNSIAKKYKADRSKIIAFNDLPANGDLTVGQDIIIPDGEKEIPKPKPTFGVAPRQYESFDSVGRILSGKAGTGHNFPYGYCTWYVAQRRYVPWGGNAGTWLYHAKAAGYATGRTPRVGAIMVSSESWYGHVAIVEKVSGSTMTVSEMNYRAWGKKDYRQVNIHDRVIRGYIY